MAFTYNIEEVPPADVPCVEHDVQRAKKFLQKHSPDSGDSLYDHLTDVLNKILTERPKNAVDIFEEYSRKLKEERFRTQTDHLRDLYVPPVQYEQAKKLIRLFQNSRATEGRDEDKDEDEEDDDAKRRKPDMLDLLFYFEQTGVGLPRSEMVLLNLTIRELMASKPIENVRFWGKILGKPKNYYVIEADMPEEELSRRLEELEVEKQERQEKENVKDEATVGGSEEESSGKTGRVAAEENAPNNALETDVNNEKKHLVLVFPPMPKNLWKLPPDVPPEQLGSGVNKKIYFVCNSPGLDEWVELPTVTAQQIVIARQIVRYFTGNLETPILTSPPFLGTEKNYLRAQIARISSATLVSPIGYYVFGGEEEEEEIGEEEGTGGIISENPHYDPLSIKDLIDPSMSNWSHHSPHILKQGRTVWWNPRKEEGEEEAGEEEEEDEEDLSEEEKEVGPPLLTPLSEDESLEVVPPWTTRQSSLLQPDTAVAIVRSNLWPGAYAFAVGKKFANMYIGRGHKYTAHNHSPAGMPQVCDQYKIGPEVMEIQDPTFEEEEAWRIAHMPIPKVPPMGEEEEEEEEDVEEDDDDEDEDE